jgi:hypothetical protein
MAETELIYFQFATLHGGCSNSAIPFISFDFTIFHKECIVSKPLSSYTDKYNARHHIKFKGPNEYFRNGPLFSVYVIQVTSHGRIWFISIDCLQVIRTDKFNFFYLSVYLL